VRPALLAAAAVGALNPGCRCGRPPDAPRPPLPDAAIATLWAAGDGEAIERDSAQAPRTSAVWDGARVVLHAAGNEVIAFQLVVRAGRRGITRLHARLPELVAGTDRIPYAPPGADPSDFRGRDIALYSVGYMNVTRAGRADWSYNPDGPDAPADPTGWKPVQLIPENARPGRGGLPLAVRAGDNQALWFEIYTGRGQPRRQYPAGSYHGTITVTAETDAGAETRSVPVTLELSDVTLPDDNALTAMLYYEPEQPELYQGANLDAVYHRFAHRQRVELVQGYDLASLRAAEGRFRGGDFTPAAGYRGPGEGVGNRVAPASFYGPGEGWADRATAWPRADAWMGYLAERLPRAITFLYMVDEPDDDQFPGIRRIAEVVHGNPGPGRRLPIFVTHAPTAGLAGAIDVWCSLPNEYDVRRARSERAAGRDHWFYNGGRPAGAALVMDAPPTDARMIPWAAWKAGTPVYFYWHAVHWQHNGQKKRGDRRQDVWADPVTFDSRNAAGKGDVGNGEGVLLYPGTEKLHPAQDRGIAGPISTLRLANLRRGLQDHLYLTLARQRGLQPLVDELVAAIVPRVFTDAGKGPVSFPQDTDSYERARLRLLRALAPLQ
jgi:hypothetical protein